MGVLSRVSKEKQNGAVLECHRKGKNEELRFNTRSGLGLPVLTRFCQPRHQVYGLIYSNRLERLRNNLHHSGVMHIAQEGKLCHYRIRLMEMEGQKE